MRACVGTRALPELQMERLNEMLLCVSAAYNDAYEEYLRLK